MLGWKAKEGEKSEKEESYLQKGTLENNKK